MNVLSSIGLITLNQNSGISKSNFSNTIFEQPHNETTGNALQYTRCYFSKNLKISGNSPILKLTDCFVNELEISSTISCSIQLVDCSVNSFKFTSSGMLFQNQIEIIGTDDETSNIKFISLKNTICTAKLNNTSYLNIELNGLMKDQNSSFEMVNCMSLIGDVGKITIDDSRVILKCHSSEFLANIDFTRCLPNVVVENCEQAKGLIFTDCQDIHLKISDSSLGSIDVKASSDFNLHLKQVGVGRLSIAGGSCSCWISGKETLSRRFFTLDSMHIVDCQFNLNVSGYKLGELNILDSKSTSLSLANCSIEKQLFMDNAQLSSEIEFRNLTFLRTAEFCLKASEITDAKFNTINWIRDYRLSESWLIKKPGFFNRMTLEFFHFVKTRKKHNGNAENRSGEYITNKLIQDYLSLKESYRQLKVIAQKAANKYDSLNFQAQEQRIQKEIVYLKKEYWDFVLLWTNHRFNNFGLSYWRPLFFLLIFHIFFFSLLNCLDPSPFQYQFAFTNNSPVDAKVTVAAIGDYFSTLFPIHSFDYVKGLKGWPIIIDLCMRIFSGYFIFYFISATRKFHTA